MAKLNLSDLANLNNQATAVSTINANNTAIETALENTLSRDGTSPNSMSAQLDMNSNKIINLAGPTSNHHAANKEYVDNEIDTLASSFVATPGEFIVTPFMETLADDTSAAEARATLGLNITTTRGDLIRRGASADERLPLGSSGYHLVSDGTDAVWDGFTQSGSNAVTRPYEDKIREGWISVKDFGAVGDGVADDLAAINAAIAACPDSGGVVFFPAGTYRISNTLTIGDGTSTTRSTKQNISLIGASFSGTYDRSEINSVASEATRGPSTILFDGTLGTTNAVHTGGPGTIHISNLVIDANAKALIGLEVAHNWNSTFKNINIINWRSYGLYLSSYGDAPITDSVVIGCMDNTFDHIRISKAATTTNHSALLVGRAVDDATYGYPYLDVARCIFRKCTFTCRNDATCSSVTLRYCDLNTFEDCFLYAEFTSGGSPTVSAPIRLLSGTSVPPASNSFPSGNIFNNCPAVGAATTVIDPNWYSSHTNNGNLWFFPHSDEVGGAPAWPSNPKYGGIFGFSHSGHYLAPQIGVRLGHLINGETRVTLHREMSTENYASTVAENTIFTRQIPAYLLQNYLCSTYGSHNKDRQLKVTIHGRYLNNTGVDRTLTIRGKYGATTLFTAAIVIPASATRRNISIESFLTARNNSATSQYHYGEIKVSGTVSGDGATAAVSQHLQTSNAVAIAENSETPLSLTYTIQHSVSDANLIFIQDTGTLELI